MINYAVSQVVVCGDSHEELLVTPCYKTAMNRAFNAIGSLNPMKHKVMVTGDPECLLFEIITPPYSVVQIRSIGSAAGSALQIAIATLIKMAKENSGRLDESFGHQGLVLALQGLQCLTAKS